MEAVVEAKGLGKRYAKGRNVVEPFADLNFTVKQHAQVRTNARDFQRIVDIRERARRRVEDLARRPMFPDAMGDVSLPYDGPALEPAMYYQWRVTSVRRLGETPECKISTTEDLRGVFYTE